jgi:hypothetical protein
MKEYGKCGKFPKDDEPPYFLVNGKTQPKFQDYHYCATARSFDSMCGPQGKLFENKLAPKLF